MPPGNAASSRSGPSPPDTAVAPRGLGFPPPPAGSPLSISSGKPRHGCELVPDTEDDARTPGSAEFFLREPPESPDRNTTLAHTTFTYEQHLHIGKPSAEPTMIHAFGKPVEGQKHAWHEVWRAAVARWETQEPLVPGYDTTPSSYLSGSCTGEQGSKDTTMGKSTVSEQGDAGERKTQGLDFGSASIHPPKNATKHTEILDQKNGDEDHLTISCAEQVDQLLSEQGDSGEKKTQGLDFGSASIHPPKNTTNHTEMVEQNIGDEDDLKISCAEQVDQFLSEDGTNMKNNAVSGGQTFLESYCSLPKNNPGNNITDIQESSHSGSKSCPNSPDIQESSSSRIGSCIAEQNTDVDKTSILEQHSSDGCEQVSQGTDSGSEQESTIDKVDQVISDDVNNLEENTFCGEKQSLLDSCYHCGKHGKLLKCRCCPIAAHVSCFGPFGSSVKFNDGQFHCPVCFCLKATEAHKKSEKTISEAWKHLYAFLLKPSAKQHHEQSTGNQQLPRKGEEPGHEKTSDASVACPERNYDPPTLARTRSPLAPRRNSFVKTARRAPLPWTGEEEAALREAVALFTSKAKGKISWVLIRERGKDVFHPARLPKDLGKKWNYMKRRSETSEGSETFKI